MNKSIYIILFAVTALSSCTDFITHDARGVQDLDNYFYTDEECRNFINGLYVCTFQMGDWYLLNSGRLVNEMATDDAWMGNTQQDQSGSLPCAHYTITPENMGYLSNIYTNRYVAITNCNIAIKRIADAPIPETNMNRYMGEALFLRAYNYFELVNNFGGVPLVTELLSTDKMNKERATKEQVYEQIEKDLTMAISYLQNTTDGSAGMVSVWACKAMMARTALFQEKWEMAKNYATDVIENGGFILEPDFLDIWSFDNRNGVESIFEVQTNSASDKTIGNYLCQYTAARGEKAEDFPSGDPKDVFAGWGWCTPTSDLENCYLSENDEIRRRSTITLWGEPAYGDETLNPTHKFDLEMNKSGRIIRKFYVPVEVRRQLTNAWNAPLNVPILRLAEMYLTRAEARYHMNDPDALDDIDIVRHRVGLPKKKGTVTGTDELYAIWKERRMELAFEGLRLYDIRREIDPATNYPVICSIMGPEGSFVKYNTTLSTDMYETTNTKELQDKGVNFDPEKHLLWPLPQSEIDRGKGMIVQNPNY